MPSINNATENFSISMPGWLVELVDDYCEKHGLSRSGFITVAVRRRLIAESENKSLWEHVYKNTMEKSC